MSFAASMRALQKLKEAERELAEINADAATKKRLVRTVLADIEDAISRPTPTPSNWMNVPCLSDPFLSEYHREFVIDILEGPLYGLTFAPRDHSGRVYVTWQEEKEDASDVSEDDDIEPLTLYLLDHPQDNKVSYED